MCVVAWLCIQYFIVLLQFLKSESFFNFKISKCHKRSGSNFKTMRELKTYEFVGGVQIYFFQDVGVRKQETCGGLVVVRVGMFRGPISGPVLEDPGPFFV
jgi:hypothetical protein